MRRLAISAGVVLLLAMAGVSAAAESPMEQCTAQWLDLKAAKSTYRPFLTHCLKNPPAVPASRAETHKSPAAKAKHPNRMQVCAAKWRGMKASNTTNGLTYRAFSSQCLRGG